MTVIYIEILAVGLKFAHVYNLVILLSKVKYDYTTFLFSKQGGNISFS